VTSSPEGLDDVSGKPFLTPSSLAEALMRHPDAERAMPLWIDSGDVDGVHRLSALPEQVFRLDIRDLESRTLDRWLREHLPPNEGDDTLYVLLLAYDAGRNLEHIDASAATDPDLPEVIIARYTAWFEAMGGDQAPTLKGDPIAGAALMRWLEGKASLPERPLTPLAFQSSMSEGEHKEALESVLEGIAEGALYQANIARRLSAPFESKDVPTLYRQLRTTNPAPFGALWSLGEAFWLASNSPECLFTWEPEERSVHSYPIKGTRPRGSDGQEDEALILALSQDPKERAEHVMIVDLVRNDLGRIACPGSVKVEELFGISSWSTVHHMVSDISATARSDVDLVDIIVALFPGGSITGAPKIAAMQWIERVEGLRRGYYCGSLGVIGPKGEASFSILIRTCVHIGERLYYQSGGGIVADSDPKAEWKETEVKAQALIDALSREL